MAGSLSEPSAVSRAADVAAVMGDAGWLVSEGRYMETIRWGDDPTEHYIIYEEGSEK